MKLQSTPAVDPDLPYTQPGSRDHGGRKEGIRFAKSSLNELFGDLVVYRDLNPVDARLPRFETVWADIGLPNAARPRKHEPAYAQTMAWFLRRARQIERPGAAIQELVYIGDTVLSDGNAFQNLRVAGGWRGWAFIGAERDEALAISERDDVYTANRWTALADFVSWMLAQDAGLNERTAVIIDIDKTALGARGRNDGVIDRARVAAVEATASEALGLAFDPTGFRRLYAELNQARYHPFTEDNQDYLAYICLILGSGALTLEELRAGIDGGRLAKAQDLMKQVDGQRDLLASQVLRDLHEEIFGRVQAGDPTPFKAFRRREYLETIARMGNLPDQVPLARRLLEEICLTQEVFDAGRWFSNRGSLVMALSDKPDEATMPSEDSAVPDNLPLHRTTTHLVGQPIAHLLPG